MKKQLIFLCALTTVAVACKVEESGLNSDFSTATVTASFESFLESKSYYNDGGSFSWTDNDVILVYTSAKRFYPLDNKDSGNTDTFSGTISGELIGLGVYPYLDSLPKYDYDSGILEVYLPTSYDWEERVVYNPMVSFSENVNNYPFENVVGLFRLTINSVPATAYKMVFTTDNRISGWFTVDGLGTDAPTISTEEATDEVSVTFNFELNEETNMVFYIPAPTGTYNYLTFEIQDTAVEDGEYWNKTATTTITLNRNVSRSLGTLTYGD